jgi:hypothetical protein
MRERQGSGGVLGRACRGLEAERTIDFKLLQTLKAIIVPRSSPRRRNPSTCTWTRATITMARVSSPTILSLISAIASRIAAHPHTPRR